MIFLDATVQGQKSNYYNSINLCNISDNNHVISLAKRVNEHMCMCGLLFCFISYHHDEHRRHVRIQRVCMARKADANATLNEFAIGV